MSDAPTLTGRQVCEAISAWFAMRHHVTLAPEAIWNMSPSGELWPVFVLYEQCREEGMPRPSRPSESPSV